jgi:hypothetical protein
MNSVALVPLLCTFCITYVGKLDGDEYCLSQKLQIDILMSSGKKLKNNNYIMCPFWHLQDVGPRKRWVCLKLMKFIVLLHTLKPHLTIHFSYVTLVEWKTWSTILFSHMYQTLLVFLFGSVSSLVVHGSFFSSHNFNNILTQWLFLHIIFHTYNSKPHFVTKITSSLFFSFKKNKITITYLT